MLKNSENKKMIMYISVIVALAIIIFLITTGIQYNNYSKIVNKTVSSIINEVIEKYPKVEEKDLIEIINGKEILDKENILNKYGYENESNYIKELQDEMYKSKIIQCIILLVFCLIFINMIFLYKKKEKKNINEINKYFRELNNKNYDLKISENYEDEFSKLRNEIYKTTILLKEAVNESEKEKVRLSTSLADISHQLKTPLTSIRIMLDNIQENPDMEKATKLEFIQEISKQMDWISSLVISLLKLAEFDAGAIIMNDKPVKVKDLIENIISNLAIIIEIKNIEIISRIDEEAIINVDYKWQQEALTNIIKNSIEHSKENSKLYIKVENSSVFVKIIIRDQGEGIESKDLKHIFERFYKAKNSSKDSIGIGLSLAKTIIEKDNGYIVVDSKVGEGTTFEIKYLK